jgi:RNA polymerase sigma factor (sigma-70 family)
MELAPERKESIRHGFDAFCKKTVKFKARNLYHERSRRREREIGFSDLTERVLDGLFYEDDFSIGQQYRVLDFDIDVKDDLLVGALDALPEDRRRIVLLSYFIGMNDREIGELLNILRKTVQYRRTSGLKQLKEYLEGKDHE